MKTLTLIRHAKSSWKYDVIDHERPLNKRGVEDVKTVSKYLKPRKLNFDLILSSDAMRAKITALCLIDRIGLDNANIKYNHKLYDFSGHNLIQIIKSCDNSIDNLLIFGHNHAITAFSNMYGNIYIDNVPTCGVVTINFDIDDWKNLNVGNTIETIFPRDLKV